MGEGGIGQRPPASRPPRAPRWVVRHPHQPVSRRTRQDWVAGSSAGRGAAHPAGPGPLSRIESAAANAPRAARLAPLPTARPRHPPPAARPPVPGARTRLGAKAPRRGRAWARETSRPRVPVLPPGVPASRRPGVPPSGATPVAWGVQRCRRRAGAPPCAMCDAQCAMSGPLRTTVRRAGWGRVEQVEQVEQVDVGIDRGIWGSRARVQGPESGLG